MAEPFQLEDVATAAAFLSQHIDVTPVVPWRGRALPGGNTVDLKLELFQRSGTFKVRGALNVVRALSPEQLRDGLVTVSAGNHAIAAAYAAGVFGANIKVAMPRTAPPLRVQAARDLGAEVILVDDAVEAFVVAETLQRTEGRTLVHPFEGLHTAIGTGTLGLEFLHQSPDLDAVIVAIGGGGLAAGVSRTLKLLRPSIQVLGVEPEAAANMTRSLALGHPAPPERSTSIADSLGPPACAPVSFALCQAHLDAMATVTDDALRDAMRILFTDAKLAVEPAGAAALAALLGPYRDRLKSARVGLIVCGSNIDLPTYSQNLAL